MAALCLLCRSIGHHSADCAGSTQDPAPAASALSAGASPAPAAADELCPRCDELDIVGLLTCAGIKDELAAGESEDGTLTAWVNARANDARWLRLGPLRGLRLSDGCPMCRLLFAVFPTPLSAEDLDSDYHLRPCCSYNRLGLSLPDNASEKEEEGAGLQYAIYVSVESQDELISVRSHYFGDPASGQVYRVDYSIIMKWLEQCEGNHGVQCGIEWPEQLLTSRMIDLRTRTVVPCPPGCRYAALSYMWGGISPAPGALEAGTLPRTIEDAIEVARSIGLRYLWVDALCIDQFESSQSRQQLAMMDLIYSCSWVTIVALSGTNADAGLSGVGIERGPQGSETVRGLRLAGLFPSLHQEIESAKYNTRAWTFQEFLLSRRRLLFGQHEVHFSCNTSNYAESIDESVDPAGVLSTHQGLQNDLYFMSSAAAVEKHDEETRRKLGDEHFRLLAEAYTQREMTNEGDSLNACLGILAYLQRSIFPEGFAFGLPLAQLPQALRWFHPRQVRSPRRRLGFPSWSFVGWEGRAIYSDKLELVGGGDVTRFDEAVDMRAVCQGVEGQVLSLEAHLLAIEVRNDPFNDAYVPGTDALVGVLQEGNQLHKNTLPAGVFEFVVVERLSYRPSPGTRLRHVLYLVMVDRADRHRLGRRAMVRLFVEPGVEAQQLYGNLMGEPVKLEMV